MLALETGCFSEHFYLSWAFIKCRYVSLRHSKIIHISGIKQLAGVTMTLFRSHGRDVCPISLWDLGSHTSAGNLVPPRHFWLRWPGDVARGILWAGEDPCMTECLECSLARPVLAQSWSQTATDGARYSTTALLSGRDRPLRLCVLRPRGSKPETRVYMSVAASPPSITLLPARAGKRSSTVIRNQSMQGA